MNIRPGTPSDARSIAALVREFESLIVENPSAAGPFWESMSEDAHAQNLGSNRFRYLVAESQGELIGFIAMRDESHLFNLFVSFHYQRKGVARALWNSAVHQLRLVPLGQCITVNASLNSVSIYRTFGFVVAGTVVRTHGIAFVPMVRREPSDEACAVDQVKSQQQTALSCLGKPHPDP